MSDLLVTYKENEVIVSPAGYPNLSRVIQDYRGRFSSFAPQADNTYGLEVNQVINSIVPAWLQMRETFVPLRPKKEKEDVRR